MEVAAIKTADWGYLWLYDCWPKSFTVAWATA